MDTSPVAVGIDVARDQLDIALGSEGETWSVGNDEAGIRTSSRPSGGAAASSLCSRLGSSRSSPREFVRKCAPFRTLRPGSASSTGSCLSSPTPHPRRTEVNRHQAEEQVRKTGCPPTAQIWVSLDTGQAHGVRRPSLGPQRPLHGGRRGVPPQPRAPHLLRAPAGPGQTAQARPHRLRG